MASSKKGSKGTSKAEKAEKAQATGLPPNPVDDLTDHSVSASELASAVDPKGGSGATVNAKSMDKLNEAAEEDEAAARKAEDESPMGKVRKSGLFFVHNHATEERYVGISPQSDPNASSAEKRLSAVTALDSIAPRTGMVVKPKDGNAFSVGEGFGPDSTPADWARVIDTNTKKPLFA